jgi:hypothetical protein
VKPIIQGPIDALSRRIAALEAEVTRLRRTSSSTGGLSTVITDDSLSGDGSSTDPLSASGSLLTRVEELETGTGWSDIQRFSYVADGTEGTEITIPLISARATTNYSIFATNTTTGSFVMNIPSGSLTTTTFKVVTTTALSSGEVLDFLVVGHGGTTGRGQGQVFQHTAVGGSSLEAVSLPRSFGDANYYAFVTNYAATSSYVYKTEARTASGFNVVSSAPFVAGDKLDVLAVSGGLGDILDTNGVPELSGTIDARFLNLTGSLISKVTVLSGSIDGHFNALSSDISTAIASLASDAFTWVGDLSGTIDSKLTFLPVSNIWDKPRSPHAYDDEFESTTLDGAWSWGGNPGTAGNIDPYATFVGDLRYELHTNRRRSWIMMQPTSTGTRLTKSVTFTTNMFIWSRMSFNARSNTTPVNNDTTLTLDLSLATWATNDRVFMNINEQDAGTIQAEFFKAEGGVFTSIGTTEDLYGTAADAQPIEAIGIQKLGTTYHGWAFTAAGSALWLGSTTWTGSVASTSIGMLNAAATSPGNMIVGADFVRFVTSSVWLP